jgi:hypothetical protein
MTDPRNIAHDKRVRQEKKNRHQEGNPGASAKVQPGRKMKQAKQPRQDSLTPSVDTSPQAGSDDTGDKSAAS